VSVLLEPPAPRAAGAPPGSAGKAGAGADAVLPSAERDAQAVRDFLAELAEAHVAERSARVYLGHLGRFASWLRERYGPDRAGLLQATGHDVRAYRQQLAARQRPASVNNALAALRRFYKWAHATGRLPTDPSVRVRPAPAQPLSPKGFSAVERNRLVREAVRAGPVASAVVATLLHTGLRVEELCSLTWEAMTLSPRAGSARIVGKGRKLRVVPLDAAVRKVLAAIRPAEASGRPQVATGVLFRGKRGPVTPRGIRDLLAVLGRRAGLEDVHPHRFRHDCARRLVAAGVDLPTVAALLGHSRLDTVRLYSQPREDELHRAAAMLEEG
jgi:site-specific recombinase XerD